MVLIETTQPSSVASI